MQDADRMESLGAIGLARTFYVAGRMGSSLFHEDDPFALSRDLDDRSFAIDHFKVKLYRISETMNTRGGRIEARKRVMILERFMEDLKGELGF
ncbi:hypothetical protein [Halobacteriovorax sp. JY17]|uniref:hypothetical protein n=1 Tax=Halobacteriovorax sp. JY17 TaxID=2014617 RepID=UPI000C58C68D|nr:hypothetical protein [Halobacteriovorax sp. JY17]PIK14370.1 MAG: hypothetical protein CES88_08475 [Halobacteriovorax sp. JY17]